MHRRVFLTRLGGFGAAGLAGCLDDASTDGPATGGTPAVTPATPTDAPTDTQTRPPTDSPTAMSTDHPSAVTATPPGTPSPDASFPPGRDDVDRVVWFREVSDPDATLYLARSAGTVTLPGEVSFTLHNNADRTFMTNFYDWAVYRWEDGWHRVAPTEVPEPLMAVPPGESHTWTVEFGSDDLETALVRSVGTDAVTVGAVGGGAYAFAVEGWWDDQAETPAYEHKTTCAVRVDLAGDQLPLVASSAVTDVYRDGNAVVVEADNPRTDDGTPATYILARDDGADDPETLVTEQVYRRWPLRDALAHAGDAAEVRVDTTTGISPPFGVHADDDPAVSYVGRTFRIAAEERDA